MTFHRPKLASDMADQLLRPKGLMKIVRSALFLGGLRRTGKTTCLRGDLIPTLEAQGAIVVCVDPSVAEAYSNRANVLKTLDGPEVLP